MRSLKKIACFALVILLSYSCRKSNVASWDVDVVVPLVNSQLNIRNFLGDSIFKPDNTGLLSINFTRTLTAVKLDSLIKLPDTTIVNSFTIPAIVPATLTPGQTLTFFQPGELTFDIGNGVALKKIDVRSAKLHVVFSNDLAEPLILIYKINSAVKNGQPFVINEKIPPGVNSLEKDYDLAGYSLTMTGLNGQKYNTIVQSYTVIADPDGNPAVVNFGQGAKAKLTYSSIIPQYIEGYFGQQTIAIPLDTTRIEFLKNVQAQNFQLSDASFNFKIINQFGAEFTSSLANVKSINTVNNNHVALSTTQLSNININRAVKSGQTIFPSVKTVSLTSSNSNITSFLSNLPDKMTYQGNIKINPLGNLSGYNDFAYYNTGINVLADINIPLKFNADYFVLQSNPSIDFSNIRQLENINHGDIIISAYNGYPFKAKLQAYLLDEAGNTIDSLLYPGSDIIQAGLTNNQNVVYSSVFSEVRVPLNTAKIANLQKSKKMRIRSFLLMPSGANDIKIYESYTLDINVRAEINYKVQRK
jgi:hypothetical protein